jgi:hypothetical protein
MTETMLTRLKEKVSDERDLWTVPKKGVEYTILRMDR